MPSRPTESKSPSQTQANTHGLERVAICPRWMVRSLRVVGAYHLVLGLAITLFPFAVLHAFRMAEPRPVEPVQAIGAFVACLGLAYVLAAPYGIQNWLLIFTGLLSYVSVAILLFHGGLQQHRRSIFTESVLGTAAFWSVVFGAMLLRSYRSYIGGRRIASPEVQEFALRVRANTGKSILQLSKEQPVMLLFLRHAGCMFCREALADVAAQRKQIEATGAKVVLVHMSRESQARSFFAKYGLEDVPRVSDPERALYRAFGLGRGSLVQLAGPAVWLRAIRAAILDRHGVGRLVGDVFQMPGVFLVYHGHVVLSFIHHSVADRPDYGQFVLLQSIPDTGAMG